MRARLTAAVLLNVLVLAGGARPAAGQATTTDASPCERLAATAAPAMEARLAHEPFQLVGIADNRWDGDRTQRAALRFRDGVTVGVKWARSADGGRDLNDEPRYEVAAYRFQKLFLDEADWVVPPTVLRLLPLEVYRQLDPDVGPTFEGTTSVLLVLQAWLDGVAPYEAPDRDRLAGQAGYVRRFGQLNLLTHLINHVDANPGNVVSSGDCDRMFAVDNGMAFRSPESPRGTFWRELHIDRVPADAVARLRALTRADLDRTLEVVAEFRVRDDGRLEAVERGPRLSPNRGVVHAGDVIQLGLTDLELDELWDRIRTLIRRIDESDITLDPAAVPDLPMR